jgi:thiol-activated cytolysin
MKQSFGLAAVAALAVVVAQVGAQTPIPQIQQLNTRILRPVALTPRARLATLATQANRFLSVRAITATLPVSGVGINGLSYSIARSSAALPPNSAGGTVTTKQGDNLVICKTTPTSLARAFAGPLFIGSGTSINQSVIYPGALFKDSDVVRGQFTPQVPARLPGSITIDVYNLNGSVSVPVQNFNNRTNVVEAINTLRSQAATAETPANLDFAVLSVSASQELSLGLESSADIDVGPQLQLPAIDTPFDELGVNAGVSTSAAISASNSQNFAVGIIDQTFFTISMGGSGPASTVDDNIASNIVAVTDVQYGRIAYIIVASAASSVNAQAVTNEFVTAANPFAGVTQESQLSAAARFALQSNFVRVKIVGGSSATAVTVNSLATLRNYIEQIKPTVGGSNAVPIRYTLRYARDNATAFVRAIANFNDRECARATQLRVKLKTLKPTKVVDFGGEELYGTVRVKTMAGVTAGDEGRTLWSVNSTAPVQGNENSNINVNKELLFNLNPLDGPTPSSVTLEFNIKDKIMGEEYLGANDFGKANGYVNYGPDTGSISLQQVRDAPNSTLAKSYTVTEDNAEPAIQLNFDFELVSVL